MPSVPMTEIELAEGQLVDFETAFLTAARAMVGSTWVERFAYRPSMLFNKLEVDFPIDLTSFGFEEWTGQHNFRTAKSIDHKIKIKEWQEGWYCDVRKLRSNLSAEIIAAQQREGQIIDSWSRLLPSEMFTLLNGGETQTTWTGGAGFFATDHNVNPKELGFGTFSNLLNNGGAKAATPYYMIIGGGPFERMAPWTVLYGEGLGPSIARAGGGSGGISTRPGEPTIIRWDTSSEQFKDTFLVKASVMAEVGFGLLFPHTIIRQEGDLTYANLKAMVDVARARKDLNGFNPADQITIKAILVTDPADVSTANEQLGREVVNNNASAPAGSQSSIDPLLRQVPIIALAR